MARVTKLISDQPLTDAVVAIVAGFLLGRVDDRWLVVSTNRATFYGTFIQVSAGLLGLVAAALAVIKSSGEGRRIATIRASHGSTITKSMMWSLWCMLALLVVMTGALATEAQTPGRLAMSLVYGSLVLGGVSLVRMIWVVGLVLRLEDADAAEESRRQRRKRPQSQRGSRRRSAAPAPTGSAQRDTSVTDTSVTPEAGRRREQTSDDV